MNENKNEVNVLDELNKGACMGMDAIFFIMEKVSDNELKNILKKQYKRYEDISKRICELYPEYSKKEVHKTSAMEQVMTWYGIELRTIIDSSTSKIAELLMQGTNMGIIEGRRLLNEHNVDNETNKLLKEYVNMQEEMIEKLKKYL